MQTPTGVTGIATGTGTLAIPPPFSHVNDGKSSVGGGRNTHLGSVGGARGGRGLSVAEVEINRLRAGPSHPPSLHPFNSLHPAGSAAAAFHSSPVSTLSPTTLV